MAEIDVRLTAPDEYRQASDTMRVALLAGPISDEDWVKALPGWEEQLSFTAWDGDRCVGHAGAFRFRTVVPGGARLSTAGVTRIGILPTHTRRGILTRMLTQLLRASREEGHVLASLRASEAVIYPRFGFGMAGESTAVVIDPQTVRPLRNVAGGSFRLLTRPEILTVLPPLYERVAVRAGVVSRSPFLWERYLDDALVGDKGGYVVVHTGVDGEDDGYAHYTIKWTDGTFSEQVGEGQVHDLYAATPAAELALWDFITSVDLVRSWKVDERPDDDLLRWAAHDRRGVVLRDRYDEQWVRLLDVEAALAGRTYRPAPAVTIAVVDPLFDDNTDTFEVSADGVRRLGRGAPADLDAPIDVISAAYFGATSWQMLAAVGRVSAGSKLSSGTDALTDAAARADDVFAHRPMAWCGSFF